jgi:pimeloyl-ACP methyl ester carboxylesterase
MDAALDGRYKSEVDWRVHAKEQGDLSYFHSISDILASKIPRAQKAVIPNVGHMVNMEMPDTVNSLLADFILKSF